MKARILAAVLSLVAAQALASCGNSGPSSPPPGAPGGPPGADAPRKLGRKMPEFTPSGIAEELKKYQELDSAVSNSKKVDEQAAAKKALEDWLKDFPGRWEGKEVPAPEAYKFAVLLQKCKQYIQAATQVRRWIAVAPEDNINFVNAHMCLITSLASAGSFAEAEEELKSASEGVLKGRDMDLRGARESVAGALVKAGQIEHAADLYEQLATTGMGDVDNAMYCVECLQRLGKPEDAVRVAARVVEMVGKEGRQAVRAGELVKQVGLLGKPAPSFAGAKWWKGEGGPVTEESFKGKVTLVYSWNMKTQLITWFQDRLHKMAAEIGNPAFQIIAISRLAKFDPIKGGTKPDMTEEEELNFYDLWKDQHGTKYPMAVGAKDDDALVDAWAAYSVPYYVLVGKDGKVFQIGFGKDEERFAVLKETIGKALAR